jgi:hypothetical protein
MRRKALFLGLALTSGLVALVFYPFETDELGQTVLESARARTGIPLLASRSRFRLSEGLSFESVTASVSMPLGRYDVELDRILFEHRRLPLLGGRVELVRVLLERPRVVVTLGVATPEERDAASGPSSMPDPPPVERSDRVALAPAPVEPPPESRVELTPSEIRMTSGEFVVGERFSLRGVDLQLTRLDYDRRAITALHALSSEGAIGIAEAALGSLRLRNVSASLLSENGRFTLDELRFSGAAGEFRGSFASDFNVLPFRYRTSFVADPVEIEGLGSGVLRLDAEGFGTELRHLSGSGALELAPGSLPDLSFLPEIHPELAGAVHRGAQAELEVRAGVVQVRGLRFETPSLALEVEGHVDLVGPLDLALTLRDGERTDRYRLAGTREAPLLTRRD